MLHFAKPLIRPYNTSKFTLRHLRARASCHQLEAYFRAHLDGFLLNVHKIIYNFDFRKQIPRLVKADTLRTLIEEFLNLSIKLSSYPVYNGDTNIRILGLVNHTKGTIFEELVCRFNEENDEEVGENWTP